METLIQNYIDYVKLFLCICNSNQISIDLLLAAMKTQQSMQNGTALINIVELLYFKYLCNRIKNLDDTGPDRKPTQINGKTLNDFNELFRSGPQLVYTKGIMSGMIVPLYTPYNIDFIFGHLITRNM